ncbi:MAG: hypothetical protein AAF108_07245 [Planctomycetota bacterium]
MIEFVTGLMRDGLMRDRVNTSLGAHTAEALACVLAAQPLK